MAEVYQGKKMSRVTVIVENAEGKKIEQAFEGSYSKVLYWLNQCGAYSQDMKELLQE